MTTGFNQADFVQVEHKKLLESNEEITYWRNALYVGKQSGNHVVLYTDGTLHVLNHKNTIRRHEC